jgi:voltage-gated potassium channel Kch
MLKRIWRDFSIIFSTIWINLLLFILLLFIGAGLLKIFGPDPQSGLPQLFLDAFYLATIESVETGGKIIPIILAFLMPIGIAVILGEGVLRVFSIYMQRRVNRKEWDLMVVKKFKDHTVICGVGEMGRQLVRRMIAEQPQIDLVLIDPRPGLLAELGLNSNHTIHFQGDMADVETLEQANIRAAKMVILTAGEDALNLETAYKIQKIIPGLTVWIRLHHSGLAELLDLSRKPQIHFFCPYQQAADVIVDHIMERNVL